LALSEEESTVGPKSIRKVQFALGQ